MLDEDQPLFHPEDRKNIDTYIASVRGYDKEPQPSMSVEKVEWPRIASVYKDLFEKICPLPKPDPDGTDDRGPFDDESILEYLDKCYDGAMQDHSDDKNKEEEE
jgi:hypothetical protein